MVGGASSWEQHGHCGGSNGILGTTEGKGMTLPLFCGLKLIGST